MPGIYQSGSLLREEFGIVAIKLRVDAGDLVEYPAFPWENYANAAHTDLSILSRSASSSSSGSRGDSIKSGDHTYSNRPWIRRTLFLRTLSSSLAEMASMPSE